MSTRPSIDCLCPYFGDVDFTMTDLTCPIHGPGGTDPAGDHRGRRAETTIGALEAEKNAG